MPCNKVPGSPKAVGYWGRSPWQRIEQEQTPSKIIALNKDKLIARGKPACLWQPVTSGITCTCRKDTSKTNDKPCPECYGTGFVPGFTKFLHETLFFTASQIDSDSFVVTPQTITAPTITTTTIYAPNLFLPAGASGINPALFGGATVLEPSVANAGSLLVSLITSGAQVYAPALSTSSAALNNVALDRTFKPNYLRLVDGTLTGTLQTAAIPYFNPNGDVWEARAEQYPRLDTNTVTTEYSFDGGVTFFPLEDISGANPPPAGAGTLIYRVTLTRANVNDKSPAWSAVRARHVNSHNYPAAQLTNIRGDLAAGQILVLRPQIQQQAQSDTGRGVVVEWMGDRSWTMPLNTFDTSIDVDTAPARIDDQAPGPHPFYEYANGIKQGQRVILTSLRYNEEFGRFTMQDFDERRMQTFEPPYSDVF